MLVTVDHPVIAELLGRLRDVETPPAAFRACLEALGVHLVYEAARGLAARDRAVRTPLTATTVRAIDPVPIAAPVLRAGLGLAAGFERVFPGATTAHVGLYRDPETLRPVPYYANLPEAIGDRPVFVLDPMLATGRSAGAALDALMRVGARDLTLVCLIAAPEGVAFLQERYPSLRIVAAALDERLDAHGYIVPGLGDAGDRLFATARSTPMPA